MKRALAALALVFIAAAQLRAQAVDSLGRPYVNATQDSGAQFAMKMGETGLLTASWTSATSVDTVLSLNVLATPTVMVAVRTTTTITGGAINFEVSDDGSNWFPVSASRVDTGTAETAYTLVASTSETWQFSATGYQNVRVRLNPALTGTGTAAVSVRGVASGEQAQVIASQLDATKLLQTSSINTGRTELRYYAVAVASGTTGTETLFTLTKSSGTAATSTATTFVITSGKRFRITNVTVATRGHATATIQTTTFNLRLNTGGACIVSSTPIIWSARSATPATASAWDRFYMQFPEGWEILGNGTIQFCISAAATFTTNAPTWDVMIQGYEY